MRGVDGKKKRYGTEPWGGGLARVRQPGITPKVNTWTRPVEGGIENRRSRVPCEGHRREAFAGGAYRADAAVCRSIAERHRGAGRGIQYPFKNQGEFDMERLKPADLAAEEEGTTWEPMCTI